MKSMYIQGRYENVGTQARICFEGKVTHGTLHDSDPDKRLVAIKTAGGKIEWAHETYISVGKRLGEI